MLRQEGLHTVPKFIQIAIDPSTAPTGGTLYALDEQGKVWKLSGAAIGFWRRLSDQTDEAE